MMSGAKESASGPKLTGGISIPALSSKLFSDESIAQRTDTGDGNFDKIACGDRTNASRCAGQQQISRF